VVVHPSLKMVKCGHYGCSSEYKQEENTETSCIHHPGAPAFHDGLKGWSCCKKRVSTFEEFMEIPGCSCGYHEPAAPSPEPAAVPQKKPEIKPSITSVIEVHKVHHPPAAPLPTPPPPKPAPPVEEDPVDAVFAPGTPCQHRSCDYRYVDETSRDAPCIYHPGAPLFHEGSKGYTCCVKMVAEFEQFLAMPGCKTGKHRFTEPPKQSLEVVDCRNDWYQMGPYVIVCVYAKNVDKQKSVVSYDARSLKVELIFNDEKKFTKNFNLVQEIVPEKSKFEFMSAKVEIKLYKNDASHWPRLEI